MKICIVALCFIIGDYGTGIIKALSKKNFTSSGMRLGLYHKIAEIILIVLALGVDKAGTYIDLGLNKSICVGICGYIILMEIASIIENIGIINPNLIPSKIREKFGKL